MLIVTLKLLIILGIFLILCYPFIPMKGKLRRLSIASSLKYDSPHNRKNLFFVILAIVEFFVAALLFRLVDGFAELIHSIPIIGKLLTGAENMVNARIDYIIFGILVILINFIIIYTFVFFKAFLRKAIINPIFGIGKKKKGFWFFKKKKKKKTDQDEDEKTEKEQTPEDIADERRRRKLRVPDFVHAVIEDDGTTSEDGKDDSSEDAILESELKKDGKTDPEAESGEDGEDAKKEKKDIPQAYGKIPSAILSIFFEGCEYERARNWVTRSRSILQLFIRLIQAVYAFFLLVLLTSMFFEIPMWAYKFLVDLIGIRTWYIYPTLSLIFLQEICNVFDADVPDIKTPEEERAEEELEEEKKREARIRALFALLRKRFDGEHTLRCYPELVSEDESDYEPTNSAYKTALDYISKRMNDTSGRVIKSYMKCLDTIYGDEHVYFSASFYSELGEYLTAYTYIRLQSGARMIFIVSDDDEKDTLRKFISDRLMRLTGSNAGAGWRVYTAEERLDQADVLIATPDDFINTSIIEQYPAFFEETSNAVVIDTDKTIAMWSYACSIISTKLQKATEGRIRFVFLSLDLLKGFAEGSLPRYFCVDKVHSFSSAKENEAVSYVLWNKESKNHRIYNKSGQKLTCLETIIAELACRYGIDGVRVITEAPLEHAERKVLSLSGVEINNLYKNVVDTNYMVYSDDRCNLSAALYATTRFRGRKKSVVHILSKPYLLREYFMSRALTEDFVNRSSFIQPRVTEHGERHKLSLLRIFCDASYENGMPVKEFETRVRDVIIATKARNDKVSSAFCRVMTRDADINEFKVSDLAAYLVAGLCDSDYDLTPDDERRSLSKSAGHRSKDFYIITESNGFAGFSLAKEKFIIFNRVREVFDRLLACNKRIELRMHDNVVGYLDSFPSRAHLEYVEGQNIIFNNSEYEIERISDDGSTIYLRHENISIKNCLDTVHLRHYNIKSAEHVGKNAVLNNSKSMLEEIKVAKYKMALTATTYGFYSLTCDRQTLDFYNGVEGTPRIEYPDIREYSDTNVLHVSLKVRRECNDGMRLLMAAVFNEFIKTIFPHAYHCVAICPVLAEPMALSEGEVSPIDGIKTLYPFIKDPSEEFIETDPNRMQFLLINDCNEDIGVLDWFYDRSARYMQEFLANIYSYLHWLDLHKDKKHFIYFGNDALPECYDLEGCCEVLQDLNLLLSDDGKVDIETAGDDMPELQLEKCSFCHKQMESGRFSFFDKHRYICTDCSDVVDETARLAELYDDAAKYLKENYSEIIFGGADVKFDPVYDLTKDQCLSEYYYRIDFVDRTIYVELDNPVKNAFVSILRGIIAFWQVDNGLSNQYSNAQLYYEELKYLRSIGEDVSADWIYEHLDPADRAGVDEITAYIGSGIADKPDPEPTPDPDDKDPQENIPENGESENTDGEDEAQTDAQDAPAEDEPKKTDPEKPNADPAQEIEESTDGRRTSFSFMRAKKEEMKEIGHDDKKTDDDDEESSTGLYDPNKIPRFWKRYLKGEHIDDGKPEDVSNAENPDDEEDQNGDDTSDDSVDETADETADDVSDNDLTDESERGEDLND